MTPSILEELHQMASYDDDGNDLPGVDRDYENDHHRADELLCKLLTHLGYVDVVKAYNKVGKWYA